VKSVKHMSLVSFDHSLEFFVELRNVSIYSRFDLSALSDADPNVSVAFRRIICMLFILS